MLWKPFLLIAAAAFAVEIPFIFLGTPSGHDVEFHLYSWLEVLAHWRQGIFYPRWAGLAHFGYGEPRFVFYPPASWMLGGLISKVFPWTIAASGYIWLALVTAGSSMFALARKWLGRRDAVFAAVLYAVNPYHLVIVYWRSAFAELLAASLLPLLLIFVLRAVEGEENSSVWLGLVLAGSWLTNAPAAVMTHYSLALLIVLLAWQRKSPRLLAIGAGAVALGACLAAFYLLPAIYEQKWVNIAQAVSAGSRPTDNFLFVHTTDADHDAFNRIISWIALLEIAAVGAAAYAARAGRWAIKELPNTLLAWAIACTFLMLSVSSLFWKILPKMQFMQFPWRWLLCLSLIFTLFVAAGFRQWWWRGAICLASILVIVTAWHRVQAPWWDNAADLREMKDNMAIAAGYEGTDEYTPSGTDPGSVDKDARNVTVLGAARAAIRVMRWDAESKLFTAEMSGADKLSLRLFPYPAWNASVNGRVVKTESRPETGQMLVPVQPGMNRVEITFIRTLDRRIGGWASMITALILAAWMLRGRYRLRTSD